MGFLVLIGVAPIHGSGLENQIGSDLIIWGVLTKWVKMFKPDQIVVQWLVADFGCFRPLITRDKNACISLFGIDFEL